MQCVLINLLLPLALSAQQLLSRCTDLPWVLMFMTLLCQLVHSFVWSCMKNSRMCVYSPRRGALVSFFHGWPGFLTAAAI